MSREDWFQKYSAHSMYRTRWLIKCGIDTQERERSNMIPRILAWLIGWTVSFSELWSWKRRTHLEEKLLDFALSILGLISRSDQKPVGYTNLEHNRITSMKKFFYICQLEIIFIPHTPIIVYIYCLVAFTTIYYTFKLFIYVSCLPY